MADITATPVAAARPLILPRASSLLLPLAAVVALIAGLTLWAASASYQQHREREATRLEAMADLRAGQIASWVREKMAQIRFAGNSPLGEIFAKWRDGDAASRDRLMDRLASFGKASGGREVLVLDDHAEVVAGTLRPGAAQPELRAAALRALSTGQPQSTPIYGTPTMPSIDMVAPLTLSGTPARGLVVLRLDPADFLFPTLREWPLPSRSASATLVRREGDILVYSGGRRLPISTPELMTAKVLRGEASMGKAIDAQDFRGQPVLGVVRRIDGTDWYLSAKIDRDEAYADARRSATWIALAGLLAMLAAVSGARWFRGREALQLERLARTHEEHQRQRLEELVAQRTRELAQKNASLERTVNDLEAFSFSVSHDLRGPLHVINGFAHTIERLDAAVMSAKGRNRLARIIDSAATMDRMIEDILRCSRAERVEMSFQQVDLNDVVAGVLRELKPQYPAARVVTSPLPVVRADPTLAAQIFSNLIGNALKFSSRQDEPVVEIGVRPGPQGEVIYVRDNGVGFDPGRAGKLFTAFQRLHSEGEFAGTGVGLSIVKRLIERHGGVISAESVPGERTTFSFSFGAPADH